jgi:L-alanine-DL-glutamate epimerase-like enolase superfamily enzyme
MKIRSVKSSFQSIPLKKPYTIASDTFDRVDLAFLEIELENGVIGHGSGSPAPEVVGETAEMTFANLSSAADELLTGRDIRSYHEIIRDISTGFGHLPGTMAAIDIALHDAFARWQGIRVVDMYGLPSGPLPTSVTIGIMDVQETLEEAEAYIRSGFRALKLKLGRNIDEDIERTIRVYERYGSRVSIFVDMNQGYDIASLKKFVDRTKHIPIPVIEQPLPPSMDEDLRQLPLQVRMRLAADESLKDAHAARRLASSDPLFGIFNIKLMKCGGILAAREIAAIAQPAGIRLFWGCNDESVVSISAALHAAYASPNTAFLDLDGSFDLTEDPFCGGFEVRDGMMQLVDGIGLGVSSR